MTINTEICAMQRLPMLRGIDATQLKLIALVAERVTFSAGDVIFSQGELSDAVYILLDGPIVIRVTTPKGETTLTRHEGAIMLGEVGILCEHKRSGTIIAEGPVTALRVGAADFMMLVRDLPPFAMAVMRELARLLELSNLRYAERMLMAEAAAQERVH
jgi:CRP-like cAMP-binding protein